MNAKDRQELEQLRALNAKDRSLSTAPETQTRSRLASRQSVVTERPTTVEAQSEHTTDKPKKAAGHVKPAEDMGFGEAPSRFKQPPVSSTSLLPSSSNSDPLTVLGEHAAAESPKSTAASAASAAHEADSHPIQAASQAGGKASEELRADKTYTRAFRRRGGGGE
eukprot:1961627-Rhodomonas_salina.1